MPGHGLASRRRGLCHVRARPSLMGLFTHVMFVVALCILRHCDCHGMCPIIMPLGLWHRSTCGINAQGLVEDPKFAWSMWQHAYHIPPLQMWHGL